MSQLVQKTLAELTAGRPVVWATIVKRSGSAPRTVGTRLLLLSDGSIRGSVGGGLLEAQVMEAGRQLLTGGQARLMNFDLTGQTAEAAGMICGGMVDVYLERLDPDQPELIDFLERLTEVSATGQPAVVTVALDQDRPWGRRLVLTRDEAQAQQVGRWPGNLEPVRISLARGRTIRPRQIGGHLVEPVQAPATAYIFGGGHVSAQIAPLAALVDFRVVVIDDRPEFADPERFPSAQEVICRPFEGLMDQLDLGRSAYVVIVTRGHRWDGLILAETLKTPAAYIGMIGSRRKRDAIYASILEQGFGQADLDRVKSPIGLD
ncbi:MAG: XdhC family protein, partial [Deltaproteobacteria bacterium]|nr:XdhC family protein [Deltaproteobacteria bacterium]